MTQEDLTPEERAEAEAYLDARRAEALAFQMEVEAPYDVPPWALPESR